MHLTMDDARQAHNAYTQRVAEVLGRLESTRSDLSAWRFIVPDFEALEDAATVKAQEAEAARVRLTVREVEDAAALALPKDAAAPAAAVDFLQLGDVDAAAHVARAENAQSCWQKRNRIRAERKKKTAFAQLNDALKRAVNDGGDVQI